MLGSARRALLTSIGLMLIRRRLQRQSGPGAAIALVGLELFGPRILRMRRVLVWVAALTVVGGIVAAALWWSLRKRKSAPTSPAAAPSSPASAPASPPHPAEAA